MTEEQEVIARLSPEACESYCNRKGLVGVERTLIEEFAFEAVFGRDEAEEINRVVSGIEDHAV